MIKNKNSRKVRTMFWCNYLLERHWQFHSTPTCTYDAIARCNPFEQLVDQMLNVFLLITERLMHSISILFVFCTEMRSPQYLLLCWCSRGHDTMREHFTLPGTMIFANFSFTFVDLTLANILQDGSTILRCKVLIFARSIFSILRLLPTSEIYFAFLRYFLPLHRKV